MSGQRPSRKRRRPSRLARARARLRRLALRYPEAREEFPWGELVVKVRGRIFLFLGGSGDGLGLSLKLPSSATLALDLPFTSPTAYGLGKSGWVTARFEPDDDPPLAVLERWIEESYRAVAPKRLAALLQPRSGASTASKRGSPRRTSSAGSRGARAAVSRGR